MESKVLQILSESAAALKHLGVRRLGLFGSFARGEGRPDSDVDVLAELEAPTFDAYMDTKFLLEARLHRRVDLVLSHTLKPALKDRVLAETVNVPGF